jgi:hypothetical protein
MELMSSSADAISHRTVSAAVYRRFSSRNNVLQIYFRAYRPFRGGIRMSIRPFPLCLILLCAGSLFVPPVSADDWTQLQHDQYRTGRSFDSAGHATNTIASWTGGSLADGMQCIIASTRVYVGTMGGNVVCIDGNNATQLWSRSGDGSPIVAPGCSAAGKVFFGNLNGKCYVLDAVTGAVLNTIITGGALSGAMCTDGAIVCFGSHDGHAYAVSAQTGQLLWKSPNLGAQVIQAGAMDHEAFYVGAENMMFYKLALADGSIMRSVHVQGQSFQSVWPVIHSSFVFVEASAIPCKGSEWCGEVVVATATSFQNEQDLWLFWMSTQSAVLFDASPDWKHFTTLRRSDFTEPYVAVVPPHEGCGEPPEPPVVDTQGRLLTYYKTKYPTFINDRGVFGTNYSLDIMEIDVATGRRIQVNASNPSPINNFEAQQTDNAFGMTVGGDFLYMRNGWFGTWSVSFANGAVRSVPAGGGGSWRSARVAPAVANNKLYVNYNGGVRINN